MSGPRAIRVAAATAVAVLVAASAGCDGAGQRDPERSAVLDRAIEAAGGASHLGAIRSIEARARGNQGAMAYRAEMQRLLPDRYRHDVLVSDAHLVQATDGTEIWATLDDHPIPVTAAEADSLRVSWRLVQASMLLPLRAPGVKVKEEGREDGSEVLRVTFPDDPRPASPDHSGSPGGAGGAREPFRLFFDASTMLLRQIEFDAMIFGADRPRETRIELLDYRRVDGIMVPFAERMSVDGALAMEERVESILINAPISEERFRRPAPPAELVIRPRTTTETTVALLEQHGTKPEPAGAAEEALARFVDKHELKRIGPAFRLQPLSEGELPAVGVPIEPPAAETRPATRPATREQPRICVLPSQQVLTAVVKAADSAVRAAAIERLLSRARSEGCEPAGPCKIVLWSAEVVQLQLPVRHKKG